MRRITAVCTVAILVAACTEKSPSGPIADSTSNAPAGSGASGTIQISVTTSGPDQDSTGYALSVTTPSGDQFIRSGATDTHAIKIAEPGDVSILIYSLATNCAVAGTNPRTLRMNAGMTAQITFVVNCVASGSLRVTTVTTGSEIDADGYVMLDQDRSVIDSDISHSFTAGLDISLPSNGARLVSSLVPGSYRVAVRNIAPNCSTASAAETITITAGVESSLNLEFTCNASTQIAFVRGAGEEEWANVANTDIYLINSNGTGTVQLTSEPGADINPAWSPDGKKIVFASDRSGNREIWVMNADGTDQKRLTNDARADYRPAYSPDGNQIAFVSDRGGTPNIYVMDSDGGNVVRLTNHGGLEPAWSPDGSKIAYSIHDGIYVMNADGSGSRQLTSAQDKEPAWSPDGKSIVFSNNGRDNYHSIWLMRADGLDVRRFLGGAYSRTNPDWSPDGRNIAFDDRDCWDYGPCPRGIVIGTIEEQYSIVLDDASEPAWRPH